MVFKGIGHVGKAGSGTFKLQAEQLGWRNTEPHLPDSTVQCLSKSLVAAEWRGTNERGKAMLKLRSKDAGAVLRFHGFKSGDMPSIKAYLKTHCGVELQELRTSSEGLSWGTWTMDAEGELRLVNNDKIILDLPLAAVDRVAAPNKNSLNITFAEEATQQPGDESLHEIRFWLPAAEEDDDVSAEQLAQQLSSKAGAASNGEAGELVRDVFIVAPRGRHDFEFFSECLKIHGKSTNYTIRYTSIKRVYFLPSQHEGSLIFLQLVDPLTSGKSLYHNIVLQFDVSKKRLQLDWSKEKCKAYGWTAANVQEGILVEDLLILHFKYIGKKDPVLAGNDFVNMVKQFHANLPEDKGNGLKCIYKTAAGRLFFMKQVLVWLPKNPFLVKYSDIRLVEVDAVRKTGFDLLIDTGRDAYEINHVESRFKDVLLAWFEEKKVKVRNSAASAAAARADAPAAVQSLRPRDRPPAQAASAKASRRKEDEGGGGDIDEDDDEDYEGSPSADASESDEDFASDDEETKPAAKKARRK